MQSIQDFGKVASGLARNPLGIIALFIVLIYAFASLTVGFSGNLSPQERLPIVWFLVLFPLVVLLVFTWLVSRHAGKLYAPKDFSDDDSFLRGIQTRYESSRSLDQQLELSIPQTLSQVGSLPSGGIKASSEGFLGLHGVQPGEEAVEEDLVFVLTPFSPEYEAHYQAIRGACTDLDLRCVRGDEEFISGSILTHILQLISKARFIVANLDGRNPNVFYELGISHAMGKDVLLVAKGVETVPFDLRVHRFLVWESHQQLRHLVKEALQGLSKAVQRG